MDAAATGEERSLLWVILVHYDMLTLEAHKSMVILIMKHNAGVEWELLSSLCN